MFQCRTVTDSFNTPARVVRVMDAAVQFINNNNEKSAQRDANTARALAVVRFGHRPPARPLAQTYRQDLLQYTAPQLASARCNNNNRIYITSSRLVRDGYNIRFNFDSTLFDRHTRRAFDCTVTQHGPLTR